MGSCGLVGVGGRFGLGAGCTPVWHSVIELPIEGHDAPHGTHRNLRVAAQAPEANLPRIRMALLPVIDCQHEGQPDLPGRRFRRPAVVDQPRKMLGFEAGNPEMDRGGGDGQEATEAALIPALIVELDDLDAGIVEGRMAVIVSTRHSLLPGWEARLPQGFDGFVIDAIACLIEHDPRHFAVMQPRIERFEPRNLLANRFGAPSRPPHGEHIQVVGKEPEHALLLETARELPHRLGMGLGFLGPLRRGAPLEEDEGTDEFIPPLELIDKAEFELGKVRHRFHQRALPSGGSGLSWEDTPGWAIAGSTLRRRAQAGGAKTCGSLVVLRALIVATREETSHGQAAPVSTAKAYPGM